MWFVKKPLTMQNCDQQQLLKDIEQLATRLHRLEIQHHELRERLDGLEGRHASLSASVRGRLGGRPGPQGRMNPFIQPLPLQERP